ncbi:histidine kinase [Brachybacterium sp. DNPG3]
MPHRTLAPVFLGLRIGLHTLVAALLVLTAVRAAIVGGPRTTTAAIVLVAAFAIVYVLGGLTARVRPARPERRGSGGALRAAAPWVPARWAAALWAAVLTLLWIGMLLLVPDAAYLAFPLFFLYLHVLRSPLGAIAVVLTTAIAVLALGAHSGFSVGGVVGPLVGAGVALLIGLGYRTLAREAAEREALLAELLATRDRLAAAEREQGVLAERARLARDLHDTVAQSLSSIRMLLHAAEAADGERPGIEHLRLARSTAADALADARGLIRELAPPALDAGLGPALQRLAAQWQRPDLRIEVALPAEEAGGAGGAGATGGVGDDPVAALPMDVQTALLRIAQGALANVAQHARASTAQITLAVDGGRARLEVRDDGIGFDPATVRADTGRGDSFGLRAIRERVEQLGGTLEITSTPADAPVAAGTSLGAGTSPTGTPPTGASAGGTSLVVTLEVDPA